MQKALGTTPAAAGTPDGSIDVYNTLSWTRSELVSVPRELSAAGDRVTDDQGQPVPSQRLASGELVFLARSVPALASRRFTVSAGSSHVDATASVKGTALENELIRARVDENSGSIVELTAKGLDGNFADTSGGEAINEYLYLPGDDLKELKRSARARISVGEKGPLVASLVIESDAPGCKSLRREMRITAGMDHLELIDVVDKLRPPAKSYMAPEGKESVNFAFPFNVPDGEMVLDVPLGIIRPEQDQMPSACKNWFTVGRWADVSNSRRGITWVTLDAPLVQVGGLTARLLNSQTNPDVWRRHAEPTQKLYCWAMNNHWGTNYRAYQEGPTTFRFVLRPHGRSSVAEASRFAMGFSLPLLAIPARAGKTQTAPLLTIEPPDVLVTGLKPSDDGKAYIVRLYGASDQAAEAGLTWGNRPPKAVFFSDTSERRGDKVAARVTVPAKGLVTLRAELE